MAIVVLLIVAAAIAVYLKSHSIPSTQEFRLFAERFTRAFGQEQDQSFADSVENANKDTNATLRFNRTTSGFLVNADVQRSESVSNPFVGVAIVSMDYFLHTTRPDGGFYSTRVTESRYTISFGREDGRWAPVKVTERIISDQMQPETESYKDTTGQEKEHHPSYVADACRKAQQ